jgi:hypothetical protein
MLNLIEILSIVKKRLLFTLIISSLAILTGSWGTVGHRKISSEAYLSFNQQMQDFNLWTSFLAANASEADRRKNSDPNEAPKHYIDIDSYYAFLVQGRIPQTLDSVVNLYGHGFVYENGILPYATIATVELLQHYFEIKDMQNAKIVAADLGHYVGDGHMPLHITKNYNGGETGNQGIHSRYESNMIEDFINQIIYTGDSISCINDVTGYVFNYIYKNYAYKDSILMADNYATQMAGGDQESQAYNQALWDKTGGFTTQLFKQASHSLTELIYTAWVRAGSPSITASDIEEYEMTHGNYLAPVFPNPFGEIAKIKYTLNEQVPVSIKVRDNTGRIISSLVNESRPRGSYEIEWTPANLPSGIYYIVMEAGNSTRIRKVVHTN